MNSANDPAQVTAEFNNVAGAPQLLRVRLADYFDVNDQTIYPITLRQFQMQFGNEVGTACHVTVKSIKQNYDIEAGVSDISADRADGLQVTVTGTTAILAAEARTITVADLTGRVIATGSGRSIALPEGHGMVVLTADGRSAKVAY